MKNCHTDLLLISYSPEIDLAQLNTSNSSTQKVDYGFATYLYFQQSNLHVKIDLTPN